jgi:hypothetical protein
VKVRNPNRDVVYADGTKAFLLRLWLRGGNQCRKGKDELAPGHLTAYEIVHHHFYVLCHMESLIAPVLSTLQTSCCHGIKRFDISQMLLCADLYNS